MRLRLRDYQKAAVEAVIREWDGGRARTLAVLPTGCGKTAVFAELARLEVEDGGRVLGIAHRTELVNQAAHSIRSHAGCDVCLLGKDTKAPVVVGSIQAASGSRLEDVERAGFSLVIIDEAHHAASESYMRLVGAIREHNKDLRVVGVTATPDRNDRRALAEAFDSIAFEYGLADAVRDGWLCNISVQTLPLEIDLNSVSSRHGDFAAEGLDRAIRPYLAAAADEMARFATRKTVAFLPLVKTAEDFANMLKERGLDAEAVHGADPGRVEKLNDFCRAKRGVLCNAALLSEGWDCPSVDCVAILRPTKSKTLYRQMVGRGTRVCDGKNGLLVLDFVWGFEKHGLVRPAHLLAQSEDMAAAMTKRSVESDGAQDLFALESDAARDVMLEREQALAKQLEECRKKSAKLVDAVQYEQSILDEALSGYEPAFGFDSAQITFEQADVLSKFGINPSSVENSGKARVLINTLEKRKSAGMATPKQIRLLERKGFVHVGEWTNKEAGAMIAKLKRNGWRAPAGTSPADYAPVRLR